MTKKGIEQQNPLYFVNKARNKFSGRLDIWGDGLRVIS